MGGLLLCAAAMATLAALLLPAADAGQTRWNGKAVDTSFNMARRCVHARACVLACARTCMPCTMTANPTLWTPPLLRRQGVQMLGCKVAAGHLAIQGVHMVCTRHHGGTFWACGPNRGVTRYTASAAPSERQQVPPTTCTPPTHTPSPSLVLLHLTPPALSPPLQHCTQLHTVPKRIVLQAAPHTAHPPDPSPATAARTHTHP